MGTPSHIYPEGKPTKQQNLERHHQEQKEIRELRKKLGRCIKCDKDKTQDTFFTCNDCREERRLYLRDLNARKYGNLRLKTEASSTTFKRPCRRCNNLYKPLGKHQNFCKGCYKHPRQYGKGVTYTAAWRMKHGTR